MQPKTATLDWLARLWRLAGARRAFLILVIPLILGLAAAAFLPQLPRPLAAADAAAYQRSLQQLAAAYGALGSVWLALGFFAIGQAAWLRLVLAALAIHNLVRLADQCLLWIHLRRPTLDSPLPPSGLAVSEVRVPTTAAAAADLILTELRSRFRQVISGAPPVGVDEDQRIAIHATRGAWGAVGNILSYLGPVLVILALFISEQAGWREDHIQLAPGETWESRLHPGFKLAAGDIGSASHLTVTVGAQTAVVSAGPQAASAPRGVRLIPTGSGPALQVSVNDSNGRTLTLRPLTGGSQSVQQALLFDRPQIEQSLALPLRSQVLRVVYYPNLPEQGYTGPVFLAQAFALSEDAPIFSAFLEENGQTTVNDPATQDAFHLKGVRFVQLDAVFDPGLPFALAGGLLTLCGLLITQAKSPTRAWAWLVGRGDETVVTLALLGSGPWTRAELAALQDTLAGMTAERSQLNTDLAQDADVVSAAA
jgi:hypothetical protein